MPLQLIVRALKLKIDDFDALRFFCCESSQCTTHRYKLWSHYKNLYCGCGRPMSRIVNLSCQAPSNRGSDARNRGVFVKGLTRFVVSDNFQVMPVSTSASISILTKLGVMDTDTIEERTFDIGVTEVLKLLQCSLVSKTPLTEVLLAREEVPELRNEDSLQRISLTHGILENQSERNGETSVRLVVCKSKKVIAPGSCYKNHPLGVKEAAVDKQQYYYQDFAVAVIKTELIPDFTFPISTIMDPKSPYKDDTSGGGFLLDPAMFTVSDDLVVTPISLVSGLSLLEKSKISFNDIYVCEVQVGKEEASRLLAASFVSESALTDTFMRQIPKDALISDVLIQ
ncbi:hypothetical protein OIU76_020525 [Salix suchowensis]|nr:hypothetical protein OIU76_020525 [Salix suchowensis]